MSNKALFWDFDGTLAYSDHLWSGAVFRSLGRVNPGHGVPFDAIREEMRSGFTWHTPEDDYAHITGQAWWAHMFRRFRAIYTGFGVAEDAADRACHLVRTEILNPSNYTVYEDAHDTLDKAAALGYRNYLLSNNYPELEQMVDRLGLSRHFSGYTVSAVVGYDKPRRELFEHALALAGRPDKAVMIGDNPVADILGGSAAGMETILVHRRTDCPCTHRFDTLAEIPAVL